MADFDAKVKLSVDKSNKSDFNKQIQNIIEKIPISGKFIVLKKDIKEVAQKTRKYLNDEALTVKIKQFDCNEAINGIKNELQKTLSALNSENSVNMQGVRGLSGTTATDSLSKAENNAFVKNQDNFTKANKAVNGLSEKFAGLSQNIKQTGESSKKFLDALSGLASQISSYFSFSQAMTAGISVLENMLSSTIEINDAMAQLRNVSGATDSHMETFLGNAASLSKELGKNLTDVFGLIETFSRLGYGQNESTELAKYSSILSNVGNIESDAAAMGMTSILKSYNMDADNAEHIADVLIGVGQKYSISAKELLEAFQLGGTDLYASGATFEESAALFAATNSALQNAEKSGAMWQAVSKRIYGTSDELTELGEKTDGISGGLAKYRKEIEELSGIDIMLDENTFKGLYDIFVDLANVWDDIKSDEARYRIAEILGGTEHLSDVTSTITNIKDATNAYETALNSAGTATRANDIFMSDSPTAHINKATAAFQELSQTLIDSSFVNGLADLGRVIFSLMNGLSQANVLLPIIIASILSIKNIGKLLTEDAGLRSLQKYCA